MASLYNGFSLQASAEELHIVLKTFVGVFDHAWIAIAAPDSIYLVGSKQRVVLEGPGFETSVGQIVSRSLSKYSWRTADDFRSMGWIDANHAPALADDKVAINRLSHPVLEQFAVVQHSHSPGSNKIDNLRQIRSLLGDATTPTASSDPAQKAASLALVDLSIEQLVNPRGWLETGTRQMLDAVANLPDLSRAEFLADQYLVLARDTLGEGKTDQAIDMLITASRLCRFDSDKQSLIGRQLLQLGPGRCWRSIVLVALENLNPLSPVIMLPSDNV